MEKQNFAIEISWKVATWKTKKEDNIKMGLR
jgi:hypothetical protein